MTGPLPAAALEARFARVGRPLLRAARAAAPVLCIAALIWAVAHAWLTRTSPLAPRHRAEALCFALATVPAFSPPMAVEPGAALVRGRFSPATPPGIAVRQAMQLDDRMVISERTRQVGDYEVATAWLRLPTSSEHWLVVGWMEGADLALCSFRFAGDGGDLTPEERLWGGRLLERILVAENFRAGALPAVRLRGARDGALPPFGPRPGS